MDSRLPVQGMKIPKLSEGINTSAIEDRISNLPEAVLCHILSFLPTKDAVQTSPLAKRWKYLWASVPNIEFELHPHKNGNRVDFDCFDEGYMDSFTTFIERYFVFHENLHLLKFRLSCYGKIDFSRFYSWVCVVITYKVRELHLELTTGEIGELPWSLFTCKTLVVLKISGKFIFNVPHYVGLPNLKTLCLSSLIYLDDGLIQKFLSGCPALEDLEITRSGWDNMWALDISVPSLKRLTLCSSKFEEEMYHQPGFEYKIMVNAPNLEYLDIFDTVSAYISVGGLPSLVEARVNIHIGLDACVSFLDDWRLRRQLEYRNHTSKLLRSISNVQRLSLNGDALLCLGYSCLNLAMYHNLVYLELGSDPFNGPLLMVKFLQSSPKLKVLVFPEGLTLRLPREYGIDRDPFLEYRERVPECLLLSLKTIEIRAFCGNEEELNLVKYLLENGMVLEKMKILCHSWIYSCAGDESLSCKDELDVLESYPRSSPNCDFELCFPEPSSSCSPFDVAEMECYCY